MFTKIWSVFSLPVLKITASSCHILKCHFRSRGGIKILSSQYYRTPDRRKMRKKEDPEEYEECEVGADSELLELLEKTVIPAGAGHRVLVIQPYIKWGVLKKRNTTPRLQLQEAVTLIKTLREWRVVDEVIVSLQSIRRNTVFGSGVMKTLKTRVRGNMQVTAVFVSLNTLSLAQQINLQQVFQVPVFDRYSIILHIFKEHAQTKEAKLQIKLAQLPYLWTVLGGMENAMSHKWGIPSSYVGVVETKSLAERREMFRQRAAQVRSEIMELREKRTLLRKERGKKGIPLIAVIGYTNAGKTSLIKALTGKESLEPQDYLFATLDVTSHLGELPSGLKAHFLDTLGFISDIPTYLIESFVSTLEDAILADVVVHVRDISHPDTVAQNDKVMEVLKSLDVPEKTMDNVVTVGNKIDLVDGKELEKYRDLILVSSTNMTGINVLRQELEKKVLLLSGIIRITIRVKSGSPEYCWLYERATVVKEAPDEKNNDYTYVETLISSAGLSKFKHDFITKYKR